MTTWRLDSMWTRTLSTTISTSPLRARGSSLDMPGLSHAEPGGRPRGTRPTAPAERPHEQSDDGPEGEPTDVGEDRDAAVRVRDAERGDAVDQLEDEPQPEDEDRRHVQELIEEAQEHERQDSCPWVEDEVRPEDRG